LFKAFEYFLFTKTNKVYEMEDAMPAELKARFHVVALLGSGGSATVYLANDKVHSIVILKFA
jgi:hypothetical protein